jgi:hypothetical protein
VRVRDTPCVAPADKMALALMRAEWDPYRSPFAYRVKMSHDLFDGVGVVVRAIENDMRYTKLVDMKVRTGLYPIVCGTKLFGVHIRGYASPRWMDARLLLAAPGHCSGF